VSTVPKKKRYTPQEYLDRERRSEFKHEYHAGEVFAMAGATEPHVLITTNVVFHLSAQLRQRPCRVYSGDMRVKVSATGLYTYPDAAVVCGEPRFEDERRDTLLNPEVVVEVLSESTEAYDRGKKFEHYRSVPSFREYVLIAQDRHRVERYTRQPDGRWLLSDEADGLDAVVELSSIGCELRLSEVYHLVNLQTEEQES
jgi:Uma2 family endonuclease